MGLEQHVNAPEPAQAGSIESSANFCWVMSVIIHNGDSARLAAFLKAPVYTAEGRQPFADGVGLDFEFHGDGDRGHSVEHVVASRDAQDETAEIGGAIADIELADKRAADNVGGLYVGLRGRAVGDGAAANLGEQTLHIGIVEANDHGTIEGHLVDELDEGGADVLERG